MTTLEVGMFSDYFGRCVVTTFFFFEGYSFKIQDNGGLVLRNWEVP
jgi:hypothetical protein